MTELPARLVNPDPGSGGRSHWEVTPLGLQMVEELAARGCHVATIARALGMHVATFRQVRKRDAEVDEAYQRGLAREHDVLVGNLRTLADQGNVIANLFLLKARHGYREGEPPEFHVSVDSGGVILVPQKQNMADFLRDHAEPIRDPDLIEGRALPAAGRGDWIS